MVNGQRCFKRLLLHTHNGSLFPARALEKSSSIDPGYGSTIIKVAYMSGFVVPW
jgi:hypothetical protein